MYPQLFKRSLMASIVLLVLTQLYVPESHARSAYFSNNPAHTERMNKVTRPIAGRNRRAVAMSAYRGLYPRALNDQIRVSTQISKLRINVLSNDSGNSLKIKDVNKQSAKGGRIYLQGKHVVYSPKRNFRGWDSFWYAVVDANGYRHSAKVNVCVCSV